MKNKILNDNDYIICLNVIWAIVDFRWPDLSFSLHYHGRIVLTSQKKWQNNSTIEKCVCIEMMFC